MTPTGKVDIFVSMQGNTVELSRFETFDGWSVATAGGTPTASSSWSLPESRGERCANASKCLDVGPGVIHATPRPPQAPDKAIN